MRGISLALLLAAAVPAAAQTEAGVALRQNTLYSDGPAGAYWLSGTFVRPTFLRRGSGWHMEAALELAALANSLDRAGLGAAQAGGSAFARGAYYERFDLTLDPVADPDKQARLRVERFKAARRFGAFDVEVGRQPVTLGTSHFVGVLDVLAPFPPGDLDAIYKPGIDAARLRTGWGAEGEVELIAAAADPWRESAGVLRLRRPLGGIDLEAVGGRFRRRAFGGVGWEGDAGPVAVWGEGAVFEHSGSPRVSFVAGGERRLGEGKTLGAGYLFQEFGARSAAGLAAAAADAPYRQGWAFLGARQYALLTAHWEVHPLVHLDLSGLFNLTDASTLWQPRLTWNAADEADLALYAWKATGRAGRSEFGSAADGVGLYARIFL